METRIVFFGNSKYSVIDARALEARFGLSAIVTIPDRKGSRGKIEISPVKLFAQEKGVLCIEAVKLTSDVIEKIHALTPDFLIVADYGLILPKKLLEVPSKAALNVHHSLLPKYRGPSPVPATILNGDSEAGVSIIEMNDRVDAGDILKQVRYTLQADETTDSLLTKLNELGAQAAIESVEAYLTNTVVKTAQQESEATHTPYMSPKDGQIDLRGDPVINWRKIRAYGEWPGAFFTATRDGKNIRVKIKKARFENGELVIERVVPENKREMDYADFTRGLR